MIKQAKDQVKKHSGKINIAAYTALIIAGVSGYTNLAIEHGELKSDVKHLEYSLESCVHSED